MLTLCVTQCGDHVHPVYSLPAEAAVAAAGQGRTAGRCEECHRSDHDEIDARKDFFFLRHERSCFFFPSAVSKRCRVSKPWKDCLLGLHSVTVHSTGPVGFGGETGHGTSYTWWRAVKQYRNMRGFQIKSILICSAYINEQSKVNIAFIQTLVKVMHSSQASVQYGVCQDRGLGPVHLTEVKRST